MTTYESRSTVPEGEWPGTIGRLTSPEGQIVLPSTWQLYVYDVERSERQPIYRLEAVDPLIDNVNQIIGPAGSHPDVLTAAARTDSYWTGSGAGYSFLHYWTALDNVRTGDGWESYNPVVRIRGGHEYKLEYTFQTDWGPSIFIHRIKFDPVSSQ